MCKSLGKPSEANAKVLASLFPACARNKRPLKFNPDSECVASEAKRKKKAATPGKGRAKKLMVVLLESIPLTVPKGASREKLKKAGRIVELHFFRSMTASETMEVIKSAFKDVGNDISNLKYLQAYRDNTLQAPVHQQLDACGIIKLAGSGSLYVVQSTCPSEDLSDHEASKDIDFPQKTQQLIDRAGEVLRKLQVE